LKIKVAKLKEYKNRIFLKVILNIKIFILIVGCHFFIMDSLLADC
jgi:hypothetical protein